jgi:hypothetical protein
MTVNETVIALIRPKPEVLLGAPGKIAQSMTRARSG